MFQTASKYELSQENEEDLVSGDEGINLYVTGFVASNTGGVVTTYGS